MSCRGWLSCAFRFAVCTASFAFAAIILIAYFRENPRVVHEFASQHATWLQYGILFSACLLAATLVVRGLSVRLSHLREIENLKRRPPIWLAALLGVSIAAVVDVLVGFGSETYRGTLLDWLAFGALPIAIAIWWTSCQETTDEPSNAVDPEDSCRSTDASSPKQIDRWLESDQPAPFDLFDRLSSAGRIADLITAGCRSIGIVGRFGVGKSSLCRFVHQELESRQGTTVFVSFSCWGYDNSKRAVVALLKECLDETGKLVDTRSIESLPRAYLSEIKGSGSVGSAVALLVGEASLDRELRRLNEILGKIKARLVIFIEDADRSETDDFRIAEICGFLDRLKAFGRIQTVVAGGDPSASGIDFARLCDVIEPLTDLTAPEVSSVVDLFIASQESPRYPVPDVSGPTESRLRGELAAYRQLWTPDELALTDAFARLLSTPRGLRHALRATRDFWQSLRGEVPFDGLLILNALRFGAPEAFNFLLRNWELVGPSRRQATSDFDRAGETRRRSRTAAEWETVTSAADWDVEAVLTLIAEVLPGARFWLEEGQSPWTSESESPPQSLTTARYWSRAVRGTLLPDEIRDQAILKELTEWRQSRQPDAAMISNLIDDETYAERWRPLFLASLDGHHTIGTPDSDDDFSVAEQVIQRLLAGDEPHTASENAGYQAVVHVLKRRSRERQNAATWLVDRVCESFDHSVLFAAEIRRDLGDESTGTLLTHQEVNETATQISEAARERIECAHDLEDRLYSGNPYALRLLVFDRRGNREPHQFNDEERRQRAERWMWLAPLLLAGIEAGLPRCIANGLELIATERAEGGGVELDKSVLVTLFPTETEQRRLLDGLLSQMDEVAELRCERMRLIVSLLSEHLRQPDQAPWGPASSAS